MLHQDLSIPKPEKTYQGLNAGHSIVSGVSQESAKGNDGSEVGKVEEDDGWHALHWQGVPEHHRHYPFQRSVLSPEVTEIVGFLPLDVVDEPTKQSAWSH